MGTGRGERLVGRGRAPARAVGVPLGSINHDEQTYVFSARLLGHGHLTLPESFAPFRPWAAGVRNGKVVLKYTPVWPAVLAVGDKLGSTRLGAAAAAGVAVALMGLLGREVFGRWTEGLLAAVFLALSPLFFLQTGTYLPYVFQLVLNLAVVYLVLGAFRRWPATGPTAARCGDPTRCRRDALRCRVLRASVRRALARGADCDRRGVALRRTYRRLLVAAGLSFLGAAIPLAALLVFNNTLMGSPFENTFTITGPNDKLGFGMRGVFESSSFNFTPAHGALSLKENLLQFPGWAFGGTLLVALALFGLWRARHRGLDVWAIAGLAVSFAVGYAFFWSPYSIVRLWPGAHTMGPFYHLTLLIPLAILGAAGLGVVLDRSRALGAVTLGVLFVFTAGTVTAQIDRNRGVTRQYRATEHLVDDAHLGRSVLFMEDRGTSGFASSAPFLENTPTLDQRTVYALDDGPGNFAVLDRFPDRSAGVDAGGASSRRRVAEADPDHRTAPRRARGGRQAPIPDHEHGRRSDRRVDVARREHEPLGRARHFVDTR